MFTARRYGASHSSCVSIAELAGVLQGKEGIMCVKTQQAILIAHYPETVQPGNATTVVEKLADYLIGVGY